ncbi:MAG: hypothetical protein ACTXOO_05505 [Sodalis sp. (in: enterobacteria)]
MEILVNSGIKRRDYFRHHLTSSSLLTSTLIIRTLVKYSISKPMTLFDSISLSLRNGASVSKNLHQFKWHYCRMGLYY